MKENLYTHIYKDCSERSVCVNNIVHEHLLYYKCEREMLSVGKIKNRDKTVTEIMLQFNLVIPLITKTYERMNKITNFPCKQIIIDEYLFYAVFEMGSVLFSLFVPSHLAGWLAGIITTTAVFVAVFVTKAIEC